MQSETDTNLGPTMNRFWITAIFAALVLFMAFAADEPKAPAKVKELFADFDPRKDPLDAKIVRERDSQSFGNCGGKEADAT